MKSRKLNVCLADDHNFVRQGMVRVISSFSRIGDVRAASNGKELLKLIRDFEPDVVIVDLEMPEMDGTAVSRQIRSQYPNIKIIILTMHDEPTTIVRLMEIGIHGYLLKKVDVSEVERAIYAVHENDFYNNELVSNAMRSHLASRYQDYDDSSKLSDREIEVLTLLCQEYTCLEISERLFISEKTVHVHRRNIMVKTNVKNSVGLIRYALQQNLMTFANGKIL